MRSRNRNGGSDPLGVRRRERPLLSHASAGRSPNCYLPSAPRLVTSLSPGGTVTPTLRDRERDAAGRRPDGGVTP